MKIMIALLTIVSVQAFAGKNAAVLTPHCQLMRQQNVPCNDMIYDGKLGQKVADEIHALEQLNEGADTMMTYGCQVDLKGLLDLAKSLDVMNAPLNKHKDIEEKLAIISMRRAEFQNNIQACLVEEN